jgi:hypothetical protein
VLLTATRVQSEPLFLPCQVAAYSVATGQALWVTPQPADQATVFCSPIDIASDGYRVVLAGIGGFGDDFMAQAYDAVTGAFLWHHRMFIPAGAINATVAVDTERNPAFVAGWTRSIPIGPAGLSQGFVVRALELKSGTFRWEARSGAPGCPEPVAERICFAHARLVVARLGHGPWRRLLGETMAVRSRARGSCRPTRPRPETSFLWQHDDVDIEAISAGTRSHARVATPVRCPARADDRSGPGEDPWRR